MSYITNRLVGTVTVTGDMVTSSNVWSLGSPTQTFGNLYLGYNTIVISNPDPSVLPTDISVSSGNLLVINRGGLAVRDESQLFDTFQVDPTGQITVRSNISLDPNTPALNIIGNQTGSFYPSVLGGSMLQVTGNDGTISNMLNDSYGTGIWSAFIGRHARGTADTPLQVLNGDLIARFGANAHDITGFAPGAIARIDMFATENQTNTTRGSNVTVLTTDIGSNVVARVATFDTAGIELVANVLVGTDLTVTGNSITYGTSTTYGNVVSYGDAVINGYTDINGGMQADGNVKINGDAQFSGNVTALKGIRFSDGSNITTAGVSYVNVGTGLATSAAVNNGINLTTSAILAIAGTPNQIAMSQTGGNVTLSLPQDINTNSNPFFGNLTVGNLTVTGNITQQSQSDLQVTNKVIYAGNGATTTAAINEGGFVLGNSEIAVSMLYTASPPGWNFNTDIYAQGNVYIGTDGIGDLHARTAYISSNLEIGVAPPVEFPNANLQVTGTAPGTVQVTIQNILADPDASSDFVATADTGDDTVNYIDFGINSSTYNNIAYSAQKSLDGYLYTSDSNLVISTAAVGKQIVFTTGGIQTANIAGLINAGRWVIGPVDDGINSLQVAGTSSFTGNVAAGNVTATGAITGDTIVGSVVQANQAQITQLGIQSNLAVSGDVSMSSNVSVGNTIRVDQSVANTSAFAQTLNVAGAATVNQFLSNLSVTTGTITGSGTARVNRLIANASIQSIGQITSDSIVNNVGLQTNTLNVIAAAQVNSMTTNLLTTTNTLNVIGQVIANSLVNNVGMQTQTLNVIGAAQVNSMTTNLLTTSQTLNVQGLAITNSLLNNVNITTATLNSSGVAQLNSLVSNTNTFSATLNTSGLAQVATVYSNAGVQAATVVSAPAINGNTSITSPSINATTTLWGQGIYSNTFVTAASTLTAQSIVSNSAIAGQTLNLVGALQAGSLTSNSAIQSAGTATVNALLSNGAITGTALTVTSAQNSGTSTANALVSNVYGLFGQNVVINSANVSTSRTTGALVVAGGIGVGDSIYTSNIFDANGNLRSIPINGRGANYNVTVQDNGNVVSISSGNVYIDAGVFPAPYGQAVSVFNNSGTARLIVQGAGVTLRLAGTAATGNRTIAQYGVATVMCMAANTFVISGAGLS